MEMETQQQRIGDVVVTVEYPQGLVVEGVMVGVRSIDRQGFLEAAEAVGGLAELQMPEYDASYAQSAVACARDEQGEPMHRWTVAVREPDRLPEERGAVKPPHPFFGPLRERAERELAEEKS